MRNRRKSINLNNLCRYKIVLLFDTSNISVIYEAKRTDRTSFVTLLYLQHKNCQNFNVLNREIVLEQDVLYRLRCKGRRIVRYKKNLRLYEVLVQVKYEMWSAGVFIFVCYEFVTQIEAIYIKSGILTDRARDQQGGVYDFDSNKGISTYLAEDGFHADNQRKQIGDQDAGRYSQGSADDRSVQQQNDYSKDHFYKQGAGGLSNIDRRTGQKLGHHNTGFTNSYHKDETGNRSNFYDISDDQGGGIYQNTQQGLYGDIISSNNRNSNLDGGKYYQDNARFGQYDNQGLYDNNLGSRRNYNHQNYNDDRALHGQSNVGERAGESGRYFAEDYREPYYHGFGYGHPGHHRPIHRSHHYPIYDEHAFSGHHLHGALAPNYHYQKGYHF